MPCQETNNGFEASWGFIWPLLLPCELLCKTFCVALADGTCRRLNELANKTDTPGRFTFYSQKWNNDNDMRIVEVLYDEYALVYTNKTKDGVSEVLNNLYSRTQEPSVAWQQRFTQFSLDTGILPENIVILPKNECACVSFSLCN
uniref:Lipocalin/cytosolic fatty-acid binding domain-containing protein n=1 Tax=Monopterus albus TaxID=43700 RepID=A0A3Q3JEI3_MONAL